MLQQKPEIQDSYLSMSPASALQVHWVVSVLHSFLRESVLVSKLGDLKCVYILRQNKSL